MIIPAVISYVFVVLFGVLLYTVLEIENHAMLITFFIAPIWFITGLMFVSLWYGKDFHWSHRRVEDVDDEGADL